MFKTLMGGLTFNLDTMAVGRIVQMPALIVAQPRRRSPSAPLSNQDIGVGSVTVSATASSGLAATFTTTTPSVCGSSGLERQRDHDPRRRNLYGKVADQAGDGQWAPAPSVSQSFQVTAPPPPPPGGQTITFPAMADKQLGSGSRSPARRRRPGSR